MQGAYLGMIALLGGWLAILTEVWLIDRLEFGRGWWFAIPFLAIGYGRGYVTSFFLLWSPLTPPTPPLISSPGILGSLAGLGWVRFRLRLRAWPVENQLRLTLGEPLPVPDHIDPA